MLYRVNHLKIKYNPRHSSIVAFTCVTWSIGSGNYKNTKLLCHLNIPTNSSVVLCTNG